MPWPRARGTFRGVILNGQRPLGQGREAGAWNSELLEQGRLRLFLKAMKVELRQPVLGEDTELRKGRRYSPKLDTVRKP